MSEKPTTAETSDPQDRLAKALEAAGHGAWLWNLDDGSAWYSTTFRKILGLSHDQFPDRFESFASRVHPEDLGRVHHAIAGIQSYRATARRAPIRVGIGPARFAFSLCRNDISGIVFSNP